MFDIFDIQLPNLEQHPAFEVRGHQSAFGPSDERFVFLNGAKFAQTLPASRAYRNVAASTGSSTRANWTVLLVGPTANSAARSDESWARFLAALCSLLEAHSMWRVICESDCDQQARQSLLLSVVAFADHLDSVRWNYPSPIAFEAESTP